MEAMRRVLGGSWGRWDVHVLLTWGCALSKWRNRVETYGSGASERSDKYWKVYVMYGPTRFGPGGALTSVILIFTGHPVFIGGWSAGSGGAGTRRDASCGACPERETDERVRCEGRLFWSRMLSEWCGEVPGGASLESWGRRIERAPCEMS